MFDGKTCQNLDTLLQSEVQQPALLIDEFATANESKLRLHPQKHKSRSQNMSEATKAFRISGERSISISSSTSPRRRRPCSSRTPAPGRRWAGTRRPGRRARGRRVGQVPRWDGDNAGSMSPDDLFYSDLDTPLSDLGTK
jgi:hypothetical protein